MSEKTQLEALHCPFCRGKSRVFFKRISNRRSGYFVECLSCEVRQGKPSPSPEAAITDWNQRAK
ncbi:Lar family restriction alleviation protein [Comamonas testosteroni]|uniref:Lar family restriction alleviation protein n=1 Tax=Comamonas testosteroni TaxID=285 RepID=UPI0009B7F32A